MFDIAVVVPCHVFSQSLWCFTMRESSFIKVPINLSQFKHPSLAISHLNHQSMKAPLADCTSRATRNFEPFLSASFCIDVSLLFAVRCLIFIVDVFIKLENLLFFLSIWKLNRFLIFHLIHSSFH